jgi:hemerythrin
MEGMSLFAWSDRYAIDHPQIDNQHKQLFKYADALHAAMMKGSARTVIGTVLGNLIEYTQTHFRDEEAVMRGARYAKFAMHKSEHDALTKKVLALKAEFDAGNITVSVEAMQFLRDWLEHHIMVLDADIARHVLKTGGLVGAVR